MTSMITVTTELGRTKVFSPYHPEMPPKAGEIGGRFADPLWVFDARDEQRVRSLLKHVYGTDGTPCKEVTARIRMDDFAAMLNSQRGPEELWLLGRRIATRIRRDERVVLGKGVVVIDGGFPSYGGSRANPAINADPGTVLEIRDVPAAHHELVEYAKSIEVIVDAAADRVAALLAEREALLARLAEIDAALSEAAS